uniref:Ewing's tumor-associated antigen 1 n=1 Tax=Oryzias latipes TaxID=8090 RepID=A0A3B3IKC9_ORYLA
MSARYRTCRVLGTEAQTAGTSSASAAETLPAMWKCRKISSGTARLPLQQVHPPPLLLITLKAPEMQKENNSTICLFFISGSRRRNGRVVEISDIVSRIAPKNVKSKGKESPLLQWIDDGALLHTPDIPKTRVRKKSARRSSVENLVKLARQFDENMQQDGETLDGDCLHQMANTSERDLGKDQVEEELHALFDCSTQAVSGQLSEVSSQDAKERPAASADECALQPAGETEGAVHWGGFEDDWDNDDLLNDSFVLKLTENPKEQLGLQPALTDSAPRPPGRRTCGALEEPCPKPKPTTRSTFHLAPNPCFQPKETQEVSGSTFTAVRPKLQPSTPKQTSFSHPDKTNHSKKPDFKEISDSLWDDDDDALLCQACDSIEMTSNPHQQQDVPPEGQQGSTRPPPAHTAAAKAKRPGTFVRSNSLQESRCEAVGYQGWNIPTKQTTCHSSTDALGQFNQSGSSSAALQAGWVRPPQNSKSQQATFKRNMSDSVLVSRKVFVPSPKMTKCSAAEIERKKQEALARRHLRLQSTSKRS